MNPPAVTEGSGEQQVTVTARLNKAVLLTATEVAVTVSGDTATEGDDFGAVAGVTVTIAAEAKEGTGTLTVTPVADNVVEGDETLTVTGTLTGTLTVNAATLTIEDDDERGVTVSETALTVAEEGEAAYTVVLTSEPTEPVEVAMAVRGRGCRGPDGSAGGTDVHARGLGDGADGDGERGGGRGRGG